MKARRLQVLLGIGLTLAVIGCGGGAPPVPQAATVEPTMARTPMPRPSSTRGPAPIPQGVKTVTLVNEGQFLVTGEVDRTTGLAYFLDSGGWLHVFDGANLEVVAQERVLASVKEGYLYEIGVDTEGGSLFVVDGAREEILAFDIDSLSPLGVIDAFGRIAVDPLTHRVYVANAGVYVADGETGELVDRIEETIPEAGMETFSGVPRGVDVYINPENRHLYVMMYNNTPGSNSRWWLDLYDADDHTLLSEQVPFAFGISDAPGFDLGRSLDYVSGGHPIAGDRKLAAIDQEGREVAHLWGVRGDVFYSPRLDRVFLALGDELDAVDAETMNYLESYPLGVALHDPLNGRFYSTDWTDGTVRVFDEPTVSLAPREATGEPSGRLPSTDLGDIDSLVLSPAFSSDRSLFAGVGTSLFTSTDGGDSWTELIFPFVNRGTLNATLSPDYVNDGTILLWFDCTPVGSGILRSTDAGLHWTRASSGLTDLGIGALVFSPDYSLDQTVFARACVDGIFKSTDGGLNWRPVTAELATNEGRPGIDQLEVSPAYAQDRTLWGLAASQLYRSSDGGESWQRADQGLEGLALERLVLSPDYEVDGTALVVAGRALCVTRTEGEQWEPVELPIPGLFVTGFRLSPDFARDRVLVVTGWDEDYRDRLYRSNDGGGTWLEVGEESLGESLGTIALSPDYSADGLVFAAGSGGVYRSSDGGETWQSLDLPGAWNRLFVFSPGFANDGTMYLALDEALYRSPDSGDSWTALHEPRPEVPAALPSPTAVPTVRPSASAAASPGPAECPDLDPIFQPIADWVETVEPNVVDVPYVGCPSDPAHVVSGASQRFLPDPALYNLPGYMIWRSDTREIYVLRRYDRLTGRSEVWGYEDTWTEAMPDVPVECASLTPPEGLQTPVRGFGKVWCDHSLHGRIGYADGLEQGGDLVIQETVRGIYLALPDGITFAIDTVRGVALSI